MNEWPSYVCMPSFHLCSSLSASFTSATNGYEILVCFMSVLVQCFNILYDIRADSCQEKEGMVLVRHMGHK